MKKLVRVAAIACMSMSFMVGTAYAASCGGLTDKDAAGLKELTHTIDLSSRGALILLTTEVVNAKQPVFFSLDGGNAISIVQRASSMEEAVSGFKDLIAIRDASTDPASKQKLKEFLNERLNILRVRVDYLVGDVDKLRKYATPYWWNPNMDSIDKASKELKRMLQACSY